MLLYELGVAEEISKESIIEVYIMREIHDF